jgi:hypothetical protein
VNQESRYRRIAFPRNTSSAGLRDAQITVGHSLLQRPSEHAPFVDGALPMELRHPCAVGAVQELGDRGQTG